MKFLLNWYTLKIRKCIKFIMGIYYIIILIILKNKITFSVAKLSRIKLIYSEFCKYAKIKFGNMLKIIRGLSIRESSFGNEMYN